jgi:predicted MFS family arabinose efflux permease
VTEVPAAAATEAYDVRRAVWATRIVFASNGGLFATWVSRIPAIRDDLGATERGLGFALLFTAVGSLLAMPLSGRLVSALGARVVMTACVVVSCLAYPALGLAPGLVALAGVLFVLGAAVGVWDVAMNVSAHAVEVRAGRTLMPGFHAGWSIGTVAGAGLGALAARLGADPAVHFAVASAAVGALCLVMVRQMPDRPAETHDEDAAGEHHVPSRGALVRDLRLLGLGVMTFCAAWAEGAANDWLALMLTDDRDASGAMAAGGFAVFAAAMTLGRAAGNGVVERLGRVRSLRIGAVVSAAGVVVLLTVPALGAAYAGALLWGLGIAVAFPLAMSAAGETPGRGPSAIATVATIAYAGFLVGPPLIGTLAHEVGLDHALWVVVVLVAGILALAGTARDPRSRPAGSGVRG